MKKITPQEAKDLNQNYVNTRAKAVDVAIGKKDSISSWFSLEALKAYISYVESEGKAKGITVDGLRIYFGAYSKNDKNPTKNNYSTVFFVPTQSKKSTSLEDGELAAVQSSDIVTIDPMNDGASGYPPSATYPQ
jgi:hypothetical protein